MDDDLTDTVIRGRSVPAEPDSADDIDGETVVRGRAAAATHADTALESIPLIATASSAAPPYRFSINGGDPVPTDVPSIVGRSPRAPRVPGPIVSRLLTVPSPAHEVSANHLELRQEGASVVVTDLRSTNGTIVSVPGADRFALRPGESFVASPGSIIDIGDGNIIEVLSIERLVLGDSLLRDRPELAR